MNDLAAQKRTLRKSILKQRPHRGGQIRARAALTHCRNLLRSYPAARVGLYAGFRDELDPMPLVRSLTNAGIDVGLPVVVATRQPLVFLHYRPDCRFILSGLGIREPDPRTPLILPDIVIAPLVGIDRRGVRLGYGGGFYDRTLARWRAHGHRAAVFGLAFECQLVPRLPQDRHDIRLDGLITEAGIRRFI
ncbi:5-formyltetrahydrofolate cyclo-ligase [Minwuia sp.]|uniref:5-formyltetrahydrofolate cyclo-ligase n=1 Tax=Minwuia sp. TaxID=2493630 RepID=UPI003A8F1D51